MAESSPSTLEGIVLSAPEHTEATLGRFALDGPESLAVVTDIDNTLTRGASSWEAGQFLLPEDVRPFDQQLSAEYMALEATGELSSDAADEWLQLSLSLLVVNGVSMKELPSAVRQAGIQPRQGAAELVRSCRELGVPMIGISAGLGNVHEYVLAKYDMSWVRVIAPRLKVDDEGWATGVDETAPLIHPLNKAEMSCDMDIVAKRPNLIVVGDRPHDRLVEGENVISLQVVDGVPDNDTRRKNVVAGGFDGFVIDSLLPLAGLVRWIAAAHDAKLL